MDLKELGITINYVFRYGYAGMLVFLVAALINPDVTGKTIEKLGNVLSPLIAYAIGGAVYAFYRPVLGERILARLNDYFHRKFEKRFGYKNGKGYTCKYHLLEEKFGVMHINRSSAFRIIRDRLFDEEMYRRFELHHSEIYMLYLTSVVLALSFFYLLTNQFLLQWNRVELTVLFGIIASLCVLFGMVADIDLCRRECAYLMTLYPEKVRSLLKKVELGLS